MATALLAACRFRWFNERGVEALVTSLWSGRDFPAATLLVSLHDGGYGSWSAKHPRRVLTIACSGDTCCL